MKKSYSRLFKVTLFAVLALMLFSSATAFAGTTRFGGTYNKYMEISSAKQTTTKQTTMKPFVSRPTKPTTTTTTPETPATTTPAPITTTTPETPATTTPAPITTTTPETPATTTPETPATTTPETPATTTPAPITTTVTEAAIVEIIEEDPSVTGIYYVSKEGSDSNIGSLSKPFKTIQKAVNTVNAGQTVYIKGGTYNESVTLKSSGTSSGYITISNYEGEKVIIDGKGINWGYNWDCLFDLNSKKYIKVIGLRVINSMWAGIGSEPDENGCDNVIIKDCETYNTQSSGIAFFNASNITLDGNSVEKACVNENGSQEAISMATINNFTIKNNHVFNITNKGGGGEGIDAKNGCTNGKIYGNIAHDIPDKLGIYIDASSRTQKNIEVYDNYVYNCAQGITVANENGGRLEDITIYDNTVENCGWGLAIGGWDAGATHYMNNITFNNNTVTGAIKAGMYLGNPEVNNIKVTNNTLLGGSSCTPIYLVAGVSLDQIFIDGNIISRVVASHPTGTNYTLMK